MIGKWTLLNAQKAKATPSRGLQNPTQARTLPNAVTRLHLQELTTRTSRTDRLHHQPTPSADTHPRHDTDRP